VRYPAAERIDRRLRAGRTAPRALGTNIGGQKQLEAVNYALLKLFSTQRGADGLLVFRAYVPARLEMLECSEYLFARGWPLWWYEPIAGDAAR
jgi:hypothetical protein